MKRTVRLSVGDFSPDGGEVRNFIAMEGRRFPSSFTFNQPNILDGVAFGICLSGSAKLKINSKIYDVKPGTVLTVLPNHIVEPLARSEDLLVRLLVVSMDTIYQMPIQIDAARIAGNIPCFDTEKEDASVLLDLQDIIIRLDAREQYEQRNTIIHNLLVALIMHVEAIYSKIVPGTPPPPANRSGELSEQFLKLLVANYKEHRSPAFYAGRMCITPKYLSQAVKESTSETVFAWINKIVMAGAKNLLKTTDRSVLQISEELNFPNPSFFGRYFRKHAGMTPAEYRRRG